MFDKSCESNKAWRGWMAVLGILVATSIATPAAAAERDLKLGFIGTLSGRGAVVGLATWQGIELGLEMNGGRLGGVKTTVVKADDQFKPDVGRQEAVKLLRQDRVDIVIGPQFSNVMMAVFKLIVNNKTPLLSAVAGPSPIAGRQCSPYFFNTSWQNDETHEAMGHYLTEKGVKSIYMLAPNYQAGRDTLNGFKRFFKGKIVGETYTGLTQFDFSSELAAIRAAKPAAVYIFYPGGFGINFVKQYAQSGLRDEIPLYSASSIDGSNLSAMGDTALSTFQSASWNADLKNAANAKFVAAFEKKYGKVPSFYSAQGYDTVQLLNSAIAAVGGKYTDTTALLAALRKADFQSVRGAFKFNVNQFPIEDFYLLEVIKSPEGTPVQVMRETIFRGHKDAYAHECHMPKP